MVKKKCTACGLSKPNSDYAFEPRSPSLTRTECKPCVTQRGHIKRDGIITIPYDPAGDSKAWVEGADVKRARILAGVGSTHHMAGWCNWPQSRQVKYEKLTRHLIDMENIWKMIRVCNGEK